MNHKAAETVQLYAHSSNESSSSSLREFEVGVSDDLAELAPHIVFTPYIRALAAELSKGCETPLEKARNFYDFITLNFKYTYMPAYFSLGGYSGELRQNLHGGLRSLRTSFYHPVPLRRNPRPVAERTRRRAGLHRRS